jgi:sugar fermentation stimulation protein A
MIFPRPLLAGTLIRRYKRFLADVRLADGRTVTAHCPNTGAMLGCAMPGFLVWLSHADNPKRKYALTWEIVGLENATLVGINTARANALVEEAIVAGRMPGLAGYTSLTREVRYGHEGSRIDFLLTGASASCYLEIKNVTAVVENGVALFPDAVTTRGTRHLRELVRMSAQGARAVVCFCVQRADVTEVRPADAIDPDYGSMLRKAAGRGVEVMAMRAAVTPVGITLDQAISVVF